MRNFSIFCFSNLFAIVEKLVLQYEDAANTLVLKFLNIPILSLSISLAKCSGWNYIYWVGLFVLFCFSFPLKVHASVSFKMTFSLDPGFPPETCKWRHCCWLSGAISSGRSKISTLGQVKICLVNAHHKYTMSGFLCPHLNSAIVKETSSVIQRWKLNKERGSREISNSQSNWNLHWEIGIYHKIKPNRFGVPHFFECLTGVLKSDLQKIWVLASKMETNTSYLLNMLSALCYWIL